jgi:uncharacterized protein (DUF1697 family)
VTRYVALLRAVNVGGTGALPMAKLKAMCVDAGFGRVETYIASGNVIFDSKCAATRVKSELEARLQTCVKKPVGVMVRTAAEMADVLQANPFAKTEPKYTYVVFLDARPPHDALDHAVGVRDEKMALGKREIFIHYPDGMGRSRLRIPAAKAGTARNLNTVARLAELAAKRSPPG